MSWRRAFGLYVYALGVLPIALGLFLMWYATLWGYSALVVWPLQVFMFIISGMLIWGGRSLHQNEAPFSGAQRMIAGALMLLTLLGLAIPVYSWWTI